MPAKRTYSLVLGNLPLPVFIEHLKLALEYAEKELKETKRSK